MTQESRATVKELAKFLEPGTSVVDIIHSGRNKIPNQQPRYDAFVIIRGNDPASYSVNRVSLGDAAPVDSAVAMLLGGSRQENGAGGEKHPNVIDARSELRRIVWEPIEKHLRDIKRVIIIPDGQLTQLPWCVLPGKRQGSYLIEDYAIGGAVDAQLLLASLRNPAAVQPKMLLLGNVDYGRKDGPWGPLPGTTKEIAEVGALLRADQTSRLTLLEATKPNLLSAMKQHSHFLLATHGKFLRRSGTTAFPLSKDPIFKTLQEAQLLNTLEARHPLALTGLILSGANNFDSASGQSFEASDAFLTGEEIVGMDLSRAELITISACESARGRDQLGEGAFTLQKAFMLAGARSVVGTLWSVDDSETAELVKRFHENLLKYKQEKLEALRNAQLDILRINRENENDSKRGLKRIERTFLPNWSAFILDGDWR